MFKKRKKIFSLSFSLVTSMHIRDFIQKYHHQRLIPRKRGTEKERERKREKADAGRKKIISLDGRAYIQRG